MRTATVPQTSDHTGTCPCDRCNREEPAREFVRCAECEAVGEREVFEGEALTPCVFCESVEVERP